MEQPTGRGGGCVGDFLGGDATEGGDVVGYEGDVGALVAFATVGDGRQVGGIGFEQDAVEGDGTGHVGEGSVFIGDNTADANVESHFDGTVSLLHTAAKAVHNTRVLRTIDVAKECEEFVMCFADVQADGKF